MLTDAKVRAAKPRPKPYKLTDANMARRYRRSLRDRRVRGYAPAGLWKITIFLAGLTRDGIIAPSSSTSR